MKIDIQTDVLPKLNKVRKNGSGWLGCCPAHDDKKPSLAVNEKGGKLLLYCFAGCSFEQIVQALGLNEHERTVKIKPKFGTSKEEEQLRIAATYDYEDENGNFLYQTVRYEPKTFKVRRQDSNGNWIWSLQGIKKVPYHFPEIIQARENNLPVFICEGEKDADNVRKKLDFIATTTAQGSNAWNNDYTEFFDGLNVIILPDNDQPGKKYANNVAMSLWGTASSVKIIQLPDLPEKGDVSDWVEMGGTREKLAELESQTAEWNPDQLPEELEENNDDSSSDTFIIKSANQWMEEAKNKPVQKMLFGEFWHEGEICILFADTNLGKSILAVQIADSITKGHSIKPLSLEVEAQKVLYFDFELSDRQFISRYSENNSGYYLNTYKFDDNLLRVEINPDGNLADSFAEYEKSLITSIQKAIEETDGRILIVDNLTYLRSDNEKAKDALPLMKELKSLKEKYGLSIMALAHTPKRDMTKPITINDLQGSKMLGNFCDSVYAIGQSNKDSGLRYLKQIKARQTGIIYNEENVCVGEITKSNNFLKFEFLGFGNEREHLSIPSENDKEALIYMASDLEFQGKTQREIASILDISLGKANSLLKKAKELPFNPSKYVQDVQTVQPLFDLNNMNIEDNSKDMGNAP